MVAWFQEHGPLILALLGGIGVFTFVASLVALPIIVAKMPADFFVRPRATGSPWKRERPLRTTVLYVLRNLLGLAMLLGGIAMLVLPGQGILTIAIGLLIMDFPRKRALEVWLLSRAPIRSGINWLRQKAKEPPLELPTP